MNDDSRRLTRMLERPFGAIAFDWDGTAVPDRQSDASAAVDVITELLQLNVKIAIITGTNFNNVDRQATHLIKGPFKRQVFVLTNRGSEVFSFDEHSQPEFLHARKATDRENELLTKVVEAVRDGIEGQGGRR